MKFQAGLLERELAYVIDVQPQAKVWIGGKEPLPAKPWPGRGRPPTNLRRAPDHQPVAVVAAAALLHALIPFTPPPNPALRGKPVLITGGERDPICPPELTRTLADHFRQQGAATRLLFHPGGHELAPPELAAVRDFVAVAAGRGGASG